MVCNNDYKLTNLEKKSNKSIMDGAPALQLVTEEETDVAAVLIQGVRNKFQCHSYYGH